MDPSPTRGPRAFWYRVTGASMAPALVEGDEVFLCPRRREARPGQVVLARGADGRWRIHRVVSWGPSAVVTRGDACVRADAPVEPVGVLWVALRRRRDGRVSPIPRAPRGPRRMWRLARARVLQRVGLMPRVRAGR